MSRNLRFAAVIALLSVLLAACSCSEPEYYERLDQSSTTTSVSQTDSVPTQTTAVQTWSLQAPRFLTGTYSMSSANSTVQTVAGGTGGSYYRSDQEYNYDLAINVAADGSLTCVYTFTRVYWTYEVNDDSYVFDTNNSAGYNSDTAMYYDLIGCSFTVTVDAAMNVTGISGVSEIISAHPTTAALISEDNLLVMAKDVFYALPQTLGYKTSWNLNQSGVDTVFTLMQYKDGELGADIVGAEQVLPGDSYDASTGFTTRYSEIGRLSGTLRMNASDRAVQSFSYRQTSKGLLISENETYDFDVVVSSSCKITRKA